MSWQLGTLAAGLWLLLAAGPPARADEAAVAELLRRSTPPAGVVFEIVDDDEAALEQALPRVRAWVARLRARFPALPVAVVSHGDELLALAAPRLYPEVHRQVEDLVSEGVSLHVCGTYAGWQGVAAEAFPDYVDVVPQGPAQIDEYEALGYLRIGVD